MKKLDIFKTLVLTLTMLSVPSSYAWADTWDGSITNNAANKFAENGITLKTAGQPNSETNPYTIDNAKEFAYFMRIVHEKWTGYTSAYYWELTADIDLDNITWVHGSNTANSFQGHFDGGGHTISNIKLDVTTNSNYGLFPTVQGASATNLAEVKNLKISGVTFTSAASRGGNTRLGALAGYVKQANISDVTVNGVTFTYTNAITNTNQLGGAIGCMENNTTLDNVDVTGVTASFAAATTKLYLGGLVGQSGSTANTNKITNCDVKTVQVTHSSNITGETQIGGLVGQANTSLKVINNNTVAGQSGVNDGKAFDVSVSGSTVNFYAGGLLGYTIGDSHEVKNNTVEKVYITNTGTINGGRLGGFIGYVESNNTTSRILVKGNTATTVNIQVDGNTVGTPYLAGFIGYVKGKASPNNRSTIEGNTVTSPTVTMNGIVNNGFYMGGFLGYADAQTNLFNNKVASPVISLTNEVNAETYVGGAVGRQAGYTTIDGMTVTNGSITGPAEDKNVKNNVVFNVGGFIGQQNTSGTVAYQTNKFMNVAVSNMTINLGHYVPGGVVNNHKFAVGGIAGSVHTPNKDANGVVGMPENIVFNGGKIYAPYAATSPTVANFNASVAAQNNYTGDNVTTLDALDLRKTKTWYYTDYKLGLSDAIVSGSNILDYDKPVEKDKFRRNYSAIPAEDGSSDGVKYINVNNTTFKKQNRYMDNERQSWTVLWWTNQGSYSATGGAAQLFTEEEQPIYPQSGFSTVGTAELVKFPWYMYFYQGVANATYVAGTDAANVVAGIEANILQAAQEHPVELTVKNANEKKRGFDARTITVSAKQDEADVTGTYTYKWYVDGTEQTASGSSITLAPHWKYAQGVTVIAMNGGTKVATASYTLPVGVLKTKKGDADLVGMSINDRGTKANPYLIDCDYALRQLSFLSTLGTGYRWEGLTMPTAAQNTGGVANQTQGHYNRAYYELSNDITMTSETFVPISHMGYNGNGNDGTYTNNYVFQGNFDGKGHKISGLNIIWGAGQYNGNDANVYHGLFGAAGHTTVTAKWGDGTATSNTVIQNLVIDNATLKHDPANNTFSYRKSYSHITGDNYNNCMVGVLAGVVAANTTVQNIEIRGSKITDEGTSADYSLATKGLFVGGAIGSVQAQYNNTSIPTNTVIKNIVVGTDITLTKAKIQDQAIAQQGSYNVGGIIGRFASTNGNLTATQAVMPKYLLYTGSIKAYHNGEEGRKDAMISPVIAATRYSGNSTVNLGNISKIWEGNNNAAEQLTVADALYYDFYISDANGNMHLVTEDYPDKVCPNGARAQDTHTDGNETAAGYLAQRYQGVNYDAKFMDAATYGGDADGGKRMAISILNSHSDVTMYWEWTSGDNTPHMTATPSLGAYIVPVVPTTDEDKDKYDVVGTAATAGRYYKWYVDGVLQDEHSSTLTKPADINDIYIKAEVYENSAATSPIAVTQNLVIKGEFKVNTSISKENDTYTVGLKRGSVDIIANPDSRLTITYQWYKGTAVNVNTAELLSGQTASYITIDKAALGDANNLFCHVKITLTDSDPEKILFEGNISQYVRDANVVYLQLQDTFVDSKGVTHNKPATSGDGTVGNPVTSWANAYAKLNGYTVPTQDYVTGHGGTWTSETNFDDETYYLAHKAEYLYDTYKCDGNKRKVKPIEECTNNWENNVIVLMGLSTDGYFNTGETDQHAKDGVRANKPVTITGQWNGTNYYGYLSNLSGDFSINADHKFENMGLGVLDKEASATASIRYRIYAHRWNVWAGQGLLMGWAAALEWGPDVVPVNGANKKIYKITSADVSTGTPVGKYACDIAIMGGYLNDNTSENPEMFEYINHGRDDIGQQIKIESGFWGPVCPGNRQTDSGNTITTYYTMGGPDHPAKTNITVDIDRKWNDGNDGKRAQFNSAMSPATVDIGCLLTGNHEGTMYADVTLDILSGKMGRMVNGIKGAQRRQITKPNSFTTDGHYRHIVKYGTTWTEIAAPAPDSYFGRGILNFDPSSSENNTDPKVDINKRVDVVELYCGGLGRGHNDGSYHPEVRSYFYGLCEVNIKGGTFQKTIYGSGAGGTNGIGTADNHTDDDGIPYWNTTLDAGKTRVWYAPYEYIKTENNFEFVKVKVTGTGSDDENLENGYINLEKTRNIINITGGIFGSEERPVSIYAGGNGETDAALVNPSGTPGGDVKNKYNTPNHQAGNMYGAKDGLTTQINISGSENNPTKIYGSIFGGGKGTLRYYRYFLRAPNDVVAYNAENQGYTHIMNPGGDTYNKVGGKDWQNIINSRKNADRYLNLGQVYGNTQVSISGNVEIFGNVYGGGEGVSDITVDELFSEADSEFGLANQLSSKDDIIIYEGTATNGKRSAHVVWGTDKFVSFPGMGKIFGDAGVEISGDVTIHGNVYGGGKAGAIKGKTQVDVKGNVNIFGEVYGAGQGLLVDKAKDYKQVATIVGDATVNLSENATIWQDMFGGGQNAVVDGNTYFNMIGGHVAANVFGGGKGDIKKNNDDTYKVVDNALVVTSADIFGNTNVNITGGDVIWDRTTQADALTITTHIFTKNIGTEGNPVYDIKYFTDADLAEENKTLEQKKTDLSDYIYSSKTETSPVIRGEVVYWDTNKPSSYKANRGAAGNKLPGKVDNTLFYDDATKRFLIEHNIFGGGYIACNVGKYYKVGDEEVTNGTKHVGDLVDGTGTANVSMTRGLGDNRLTATTQWKQSFKDFAHPHFYAFGGGYGAYTTVANTIVDVNVANYDSSLSADTDDQLARPRRPIISGDPIDDDPIAIGVYNNQYGIAQATVLGVLGGSYAGFVKQNTDVTIGGKTFISRVYGGGFGQLDAYNELAGLGAGYLMKAADDAFFATKTREFLGEVGGKTLVNIKGGNIYGNVYGGGAGVESSKVEGGKLVSLADNEINAATKDFVMGRVMGKTDVNIFCNANVFGNVYGGGDIANVLGEGNDVDRTRIKTNAILDDDFATNLNIFGGKVYGNVFGGGSGRPANKVASYNQANDNFNSIRVGMVGKDLTDYPGENLVNLQGHTRVHIYNGIATQEDVDLGIATNVGDPIWPYVYGDIYGGCAYGVVTGTSEVLIDGGRIGNDIFGGGLGDIEQTRDGDGNVTYGKVTSANVLGNSIVTINGGYAMWNEMSDAKGNVKVWPRENYISQNTEITDANEYFYNAATKRFVLDHNVYGGGNVACVVGRYTNKTNKTTANDAFSSSDTPVKRFPVLFKEGEFKSGNTIVMMNESHFSDPELFMNYADWTEEPKWSLAAKCWQATMEEQREPQFSVFGAGKGLLTKTVHNAQSRVEVLAVKYDINGQLIMNGGKPEEHWTVGWDEDYEHMLQWNEEDNDGGTYKARLANFYPEKEWVRPNYVDAERRLRTAAFAKQIGVAGNTVMQIVGGGYDGCVEGNTISSGESRAIIGKMYGGGYGSYDGWKLARALDAANSNEHNYQSKVGTVGGQAVLNIDRGNIVRGDVFAGGAGVESRIDVNDDDADSETDDYIDFPEVARVGSTHLKFGLFGASSGYDFVVPVVYGNVYGGGDVANVTGIAKSELLRGQVMQYFFGGGKGRLKSQCADYTAIGGVGATDVHFNAVRNKIDRDTGIEILVDGHTVPYSKDYGGGKVQTYIHEPIVWDRVYAGGRNGLVRGGYSKAVGDKVEPGDTKLLIDGGQFGYNIFGGGEGTLDTDADGNYLYDGDGKQIMTSADVLGNTRITVNGGEQNIDQIWDPVKYEWTPLDYDDLGAPYTPQYDWRLTKFNISHNIYGGGRTACIIGTKVDDSKGKTPDADGYELTLKTNTGDTHVTMTKGMLDRQYFESFGTPILESWEWRDIYKKHASPHFCVFGGGYGENAMVLGDTNVDIELDKYESEAVKPSNEAKDKHHHDPKAVCGVTHNHQDMDYTKFPDGQTLMDIIGGGYSGDVMGTCNVTVDGNTYARNIFGGGYYANAGATVINVMQGNIDNIYGGGMMGDVHNTVTVNVGQGHSDDDPDAKKTEKTTANNEVVILGNVYGANDVAGAVGASESENGEVVPTYKKDSSGNLTEETTDGSAIYLYGGHIHGNVYGGGNGDYLYKIDQDATIVTADEHYDIGDGKTVLVYRVPIRKQDFPALNAMSDAQKIVNIATYRPAVMKTKIDFKGNSANDILRVDGNIFGGGSSATVSNFTGKASDSYVKLNVGSHIRVGGVFLGSDGDAMFDNSSDGNFIKVFPGINGVTLSNGINWLTDPANVSIPVKYLSVAKENRPNIYKNVLDMYFMPVEMNFMPEVTWGKGRQNNSVNVAKAVGASGYEAYTDVLDSEDGLTDAVIGNFCCGGNRGNMNTATNFHMYFPEGLTITGNIIGGCNNSNNTQTDESGNPVEHEGGFLVGSHGVGSGHDPQIRLTMFNKFQATPLGSDGKVITDSSPANTYAEGINVFGGCYKSGTVRGDILVDMRSNMLAGLDSLALRRTNESDTIAVAGIYGAGYGDKTWVYGDTEVRMGYGVDCTSADNKIVNAYSAGNKSSAVNYMFGGGRQGNVVGNTTVRLYNGRVGASLVGGSYAGLVYGSAQTMVGYPEVYYRANVNDEFTLKRADQDEKHADYVDDGGRNIINDKVRYTKGDLVASSVYNEIDDAEKATKFIPEHSIPENNDWSKVAIQIDQAIYGGGYALASGSNVGSGSYTIKKYTATNRFKDDVILGTYGFETPDDINGYGGNTFVMVGDVTGDYDAQAQTGSAEDVISANKTGDHITLSSSALEPVATKTGDNLFELFYQPTRADAFPDQYSIADNKSDPYWEEPYGAPVKVGYEAKKDASDKHQYYRYVGEGGLYGDGHLSLSEGVRVSDIMGYGYNGTTSVSPKLMNCVHRFDIARFKDVCVSLLGDRDYASTEGTVGGAASYSIARVSEVQMESSINPNSDYLAKDQIRSRNYVGLSNAQFELGAVVSNDNFTPEGGAVYKYKKCKVSSSDVEIEGSEGKKFSGSESYYNVKRWYLNEYKLNGESSGYYDNIIAQVQNEALFQLRNSATARNMFGIYSGYALNVQYYRYDAAQEARVPYYGPVIGVFEVDLIGTRSGEAGGYAYAQNIHKEDIDGNIPAQKEHSFLETSGNFVFPANETRKVIDNCFPSVFSNEHRDAAEGHYWYVTGFRYFYNATITGYTYDNGIRKFDMDNASRLIFMPGAKEGQQVTLQSFRILNRHSSAENQANCDIEDKLLTKVQPENQWNTTFNNNLAYVYNPFYNLSLSIANSNVYVENETHKDAAGQEVYRDAEGNKVSAETGTLDTTVPFERFLKQDIWSNNGTPEDLTDDKYVNQDKTIAGRIPCNNPQLAIRLTDFVNNNGKISDDVTYYDQRLKDNCVALVVLTVPAVNSNGDVMYDVYDPVAKGGTLPPLPTGESYYTTDMYGDYVKITYDEAQTMHSKDKSVYTVAKEEKRLIGDGSFVAGREYYTSDDGINFTKIDNPEDWFKTLSDEDRAKTYYLRPAAQPKNYEYNLTLTIKYIKGPSYEGKITVQNCALPGEMIRLSSSTLEIKSDMYSLPFDKGFWTFGPGKKVWKNDSDHSQGYTWSLIDQTGNEIVYEYEDDGVTKKTDAYGVEIYTSKLDSITRNMYYPYNPNVTFADDQKITPMLDKHVFENTNNQDIYIPAYYFMNGYVAQYSFKVKGIDDVFNVTIHPEDTLNIHNYHRMDPTIGKNRMTVETRLKEAIAERNNVPVLYPTTDNNGQPLTGDALTEAQAKQAAFANEWKNIHRRPRVYIAEYSDMYYNSYDVFDLKAFAKFIKENDGGKDVEFFLMDDFTLPSNWSDLVANTTFNGTFHGNGHVLSGLDSNKYFLKKNEGHIYNLGLETGKITNTETPSLYHCCYTKENNIVYRMDGTLKTDYSDDDWKYGKVAYDLNQYYLEERLDRNTEQTDDNAVGDLHNHSGYVETVFADGDYQYSRTVTGGGPEFLRTNVVPHYVTNDISDVIDAPENITYHNTSHDVDAARAYYETEGVPAVSVFKEYRPLIDETNVSDNGSDASTLKNDYIFFGQTLSPTGDKIPHAISSTNGSVDLMNNRVWRAYGYYRSGDDDAFHFNRNAYVMNPRITAIDFNGWHDKSEGGTHEWTKGYETTGGILYYPQVIDRPAAITGFTLADDVTRNLLVYNQDNHYSPITNYSEAAAESAIRYHAVGMDWSSSKGIEYFHLVERDDESKPNNDFFCPIEFNVTQRAWYERQPVGYRNQGQPMWEGIALPFTAKKVTAKVDNPAAGEVANGEITHFYGDSIRNHEYWLRGLVSVNGQDATFSRPGTTNTASNGDNLFNPRSSSDPSVARQVTGDYTFVNEYFANLYEGYDYGSWYKECVAHSKANDGNGDGENKHANYVYLTEGIPYIIGFPGNDYYEFSMEGSKIYDVQNDMKPEYTHRKTGKQQKVLYESGATTVAATQEIKTAVGTILHNGTYLALNTKANAAKTAPDGNELSGVQGLSYESDDYGKVFDAQTTVVLPFRTYMTKTAGGAAPHRIYILENSDDEEEDNDEMHPAQDMPGKSLTIEVQGLNVIVHSTFDDVRTVSVYRVNGQLVHIHKAPSGESTFTLPGEGLYIINGKKIAAKD